MKQALIPAMNRSPFFFSILTAALTFVLMLATARAQTPVLRWAFDGPKAGASAASIWISGGVLRIDGDGAGYAAFQPSGGVGPSTPGVLNGAANIYGDNLGAAVIGSVVSPLLADAELPQFVVTLWIKPVVAPADQPYARLLVLSGAGEEKSNPGLFLALHNANLEAGVNGSVTMVPLPIDTIRPGEWTFVAFVYDGFAANPYYSAEMIAAVRAEKNAAILVGGTEAPVRLAGSFGVNTGGPSFNIPAGPLGLDGLNVAVGSSIVNRGRAFRGLIDDVRIYSGLLGTAWIEEIRQSALK